MCGEQSPSPSSRPYLSGSPPRVRGTVFSLYADFRPYRITPACAGNRMEINISGRKHQDHPRVCGEQVDKLRQEGALEGSPPRVRGTAHMGSTAQAQDRITPACAGNRCREALKDGKGEDHPRVCGEQDSPAWRKDGGQGSPPRVRGTVTIGAGGTGGSGITPACAGNSRIRRKRK